MRLVLINLLLCFSITYLIAQKRLLKINLPPGFEQVDKHKLAVLKSEVTVKMWVEFLNDKKKASPDDFEAFVPLSNAINEKCVCEKKDNALVIKTPESIVFRDTTYYAAGNDSKKNRTREYCIQLPITGVSLQQATEYAKWLTRKYQDDQKYSKLNLIFRLPTAAEFDSLLYDIINQWRPGEDGYTSYSDGINSHGCAIYNHRHDSWCNNNLDMKYGYGYGVPMQAEYFFPDANGLYDLMGNVAEMVQEEGIAKGGSCNDKAAACQAGAYTQYENPEWWLGFRLVANLP